MPSVHQAVLAVLLSGFLFQAGPRSARADDPPKPEAPQKKPERMIKRLQIDAKTTVETCARLIAKEGGVNIIVSPATAQILVGSTITLEDIPISVALTAIGCAVDTSKTQVYWRAISDSVYVVAVNEILKPLQVPNSACEVKVINVRQLCEDEKTSGISSKTLLSAIGMALDLCPSETKAEVKYHADSYLLAVKGTPQQVQIVSDAFFRILEGSRSPAPLGHEIVRLNNEIARQRKEVETLNAEWKEFRQDSAAKK